MFRLAKLLYLTAVIGLLVVLALVDQFAPALHAGALRTRLRGELSTLRAHFLQQLELDRLRQARWARRVASGIEQTGIPGLGPGPALTLERSLSRATEAVTDETGRAPRWVRLVGLGGEDLTPSELLLPDAPAVFPTLAPERCREPIGAAAVVDTGAGLVIAACAPVASPSGQLATVLTAEPVDVVAFANAHPDLAAELTLFRHDGSLVSTSCEDDELLSVTQAFVDELRAGQALPTESSATPRLTFQQDGEKLRALLAGWLPLGRSDPDRAPVGFVLLLDAGRIPPTLASFVLANLASLRSSERLGVTVALGLLLLLLGVALFELEGRRDRRRIRELTERLARAPKDGSSPPPDR
jgi:hypothetical protein